MINKNQTLVYLKYGKLISEINNKIVNQNIRDDMIRFLYNFPGILKYPDWITYLKHNTNIRGRFIFFILINTKSSYIQINFDGNKNFKMCWIPTKLDYPNNITFFNWTSIDDLEYYVNIYSNKIAKITVQI